MPVLNMQAVVKLYEKSHGIHWNKARNCLSSLFVQMLSILNFILYILLIKNYRKFSFEHFKIQNLQ